MLIVVSHICTERKYYIFIFVKTEVIVIPDREHVHLIDTWFAWFSQKNPSYNKANDNETNNSSDDRGKAWKITMLHMAISFLIFPTHVYNHDEKAL